MATYTIAGEFRPDLGASADGLTVEAFAVASWTGTNNPPHLGDTPPGWPTLVNPNTTTSTNYGNHGAWELLLPTNEDYFVVVEYSSSYYWQRYNAPSWLDGTVGELDATTVSATNVNIFGTAAGGLDTANADVQSLGTSNTASASGGSIGLAAFADHVHAGLGESLGLAGATQPTRYAGATTSGSPTSGTFAIGDVVVDRSGAIYICTAGGSPGTWIGLLPPGSEGAPGDIKAFAGITVPAGWLVCDGSAISRTTYAILCAALSTSQFTGSNAFTGNTTNASTSVTGVPTAVWNALQTGWPLSGTNIASGTTIAGLPSSGQITLSVAATGTGSAVSLLAAPWGIGDGSTTFNVPDLRGRTLVGAGTGSGESNSGSGLSGGGLPSGGSALTTRNLGGWFGQEMHLEIASESGVPAHNHSVNINSGTQSALHRHGAADGNSFYTDGNQVSIPGGSGYTLNWPSYETATEDAYHYHNVSGSTANNGAADASSAHYNVQPSSAVRFIVKY